MHGMSPDEIRRHEAAHGRGAAWGEETNRGVVRVFVPDGKAVHNYATGLRNCSGLIMQARTERLWCVMNERDHLGPHLVPDFLASIDEGGFYGWPWYYLGNNEDPARRGERPDLAAHVKVPEVLIQAHSSALAPCSTSTTPSPPNTAAMRSSPCTARTVARIEPATK